MINFRFHLISLVAVFLALGVGVAMGASFVDRATVDSLRSRVDDLDEGYRRRGAELDATREQLARSDAQAAALAGPGSEALAGRLDGAPVVLLATAEVSRTVIDDVRTSLGASGADRAGTVRLQPPLTSPSAADLTAARARLGLRGDRNAVRSRIATDLGISLALLSAAPPAA
nr:copper transporter [Microthrixaceae bacterium]